MATQTFSKSSMQFVYGVSPLFLDRGDGCRVWDVDGNEFIDYVLGIMPITLGYRDPDVDSAIRAQLDRGISFSLATELEADLAERLVALIPCAEMVRFGKNGSDATTAAIRLARAYTGRDKVVVCGYHGWHDWYIGTTSRNLGVPQAVRNLSVAVPYNDLDALEILFRSEPEAFAALIIEPAGLEEPQPGYLEGIRGLTERHGALLIFDEIITGFRIDLGGAQKFYEVTPELATFGKGMGNGMPISALVGRAEIMSWLDRIFYSGTFGGETLSLAASIATIDKMKNLGVIGLLYKIGERLINDVNIILGKRSLSEIYAVTGPPWWPRIKIKADSGVDSIIATSLLRQELIASGLLIAGGFNLCLAHSEESIIAETLSAWERASECVAVALKDDEPATFLRGEPIQPVFQVH